jgi:uncharacterized protein (DUF2384 family)
LEHIVEVRTATTWEKALAWLETPNPSLQGKTPIEAARTEEGFEQADEILTCLEHGVLG